MVKTRSERLLVSNMWAQVKLGRIPGADVNSGVVYTWTLEPGAIQRALILLEDFTEFKNVNYQWGEGPLHVAAKRGDLPMVREIMSGEHLVLQLHRSKWAPLLLGVDCDPYWRVYVKETPLHVAIKFGRLAVVEHLASFAVHVDRYAFLNHTAGSMTALAYAVMFGHEAMVDCLLAAGANPDLGIFEVFEETRPTCILPMDAVFAEVYNCKEKVVAHQRGRFLSRAGAQLADFVPIIHVYVHAPMYDRDEDPIRLGEVYPAN